MTFRTVDELLTREMAGDARSPASEHLDMSLVRFARGVAVYEMPLRREVCTPSGTIADGVLTTLAEAAMTAAATTTVADGHEGIPLVRDLRARFEGTVYAHEPARLRAEAVVMRTDCRSVRVEAEVHCDGRRVATFEGDYTREARVTLVPDLPDSAPAEMRPLLQA